MYQSKFPPNFCVGCSVWTTTAGLRQAAWTSSGLANDPGHNTQFRQPFLQSALQGHPFFLTVGMEAVRSIDRKDMDASRPGPWDYSMCAPGAVLAPEDKEGGADQDRRAPTASSLLCDFSRIP